MSRFFLSVVVVLAYVLSLAAAQSISFSQAASSTAFPGREYAFCSQTPASLGSTPTLYFFGGFGVSLTGSSTNISYVANTYTDTYYNDSWSSTNFGQSWTQLTGSANFVPQAWGGAVRLNSGTVVVIGAGADSNLGENNNVYTSTDGVTFTQAANGPWSPRETAGIAGMAGTNNILVALGNTQNTESVDDIWLSKDGGATWNQTCHYLSCPFVSSVDSNNIAGQVHGPAAVGLSTGQWLLIGAYGNPTTSLNTVWVTNQVAYSTDGFVSYTTYAAPWSPRAQMRAIVDPDNYVYVYGGVYNLPLSGSGTSYPNVPSQVFYGYFQDMYYSTSPASGNGNWQKLSVTGTFGGSGVYPNIPYTAYSNPNSANLPSTFFANGAVFNPCLGFSYSSSGAKQLAVYTGLYAGYRQNMQSGVQVSYPAVYVGTLNLGGSGSSTGGNTGAATAVSASAVIVVAATLVALVASLL